MIESEPWGEIYLFQKSVSSHADCNQSINIKTEEIKICRDINFFKKEGINNISINGPDVLDYGKIIDLVEYLKKNGFFVQIITNGNKFWSSLLLDKIKTSKLDELEIILFGSQPEVHDSIVELKSDFEKSVSAVKKMKKDKFPVKVGVRCLVTKRNKEGISNMVNFAVNLKPDRITVSTSRFETIENNLTIPEKNLGKYLKPIYTRSIKSRRKIRFFGIPFCIFNEPDLMRINNRIIFTPEQKKIKRKNEMCDDCMMFNYCSGFNVENLSRFGAGKIKPINP